MVKKLIGNKYFLISFILLIVLVIVGGTYAWYSYTVGNTNVVFEVDGIYVTYDGGNNISNINLIPTLTKESGIVKDITVSVDKDVIPVPTFNLYLKVNTLGTGLNHASFKWELYKNGTYLNDGTFESVSVGDTLTLTTNQTISTTEDEYTLYIWIDGNMENPDSMYSQNFDFDLYANGNNALTKPPENLSSKIANLYAEATKTAVENGESGSIVTYQYAKDYSLMSDLDGNIRFYGTDPDNYIYFNCDTYPNTNCETWRIIGIVDGKVKIMRNQVIGGYSWDTSSSEVNSGNGINQWGESTYTTSGNAYYGADLMKLLNPGYEANQDLDSDGNLITINNSLYYNSGTGNCYRGSQNAYETCDFSSTGIKNNTNNETKNMISDSLYYLGGHSSSSIYSDLIYEQERSDSVIETPADGIERKVTWTGKIGVPYPSDLGYAADLESCTVKLGSYSNKNCSSTSWTKPIFNSSFNWLMTPDSSGVVMLWVVSSSGFIDVGYDPAYLGYGVVPTLYLDSSVVIDANVGTGDINNPYRIIVS